MIENAQGKSVQIQYMVWVSYYRKWQNHFQWSLTWFKWISHTLNKYQLFHVMTTFIYLSISWTFFRFVSMKMNILFVGRKRKNRENKYFLFSGINHPRNLLTKIELQFNPSCQHILYQISFSKADKKNNGRILFTSQLKTVNRNITNNSDGLRLSILCVSAFF